MGMLDKLREKSKEKFEKELEEEFENDAEGKFEELKRMMLDMYKYGYGVDDEDGYKGDINKCFQNVISPIEMPASYIKPFKEYILKDPEVKAIIGNNSSEKSEKNNSDINTKFKKKIAKYREDDDGDYGLFITDIINLLSIYDSDEEKAAINDNLSEKELKDIRAFNKELDIVLDNYDKKDSTDFIKYLKTWYTSSSYELAYDLICYLNAEEYITDEDKDEIEEYKSNNKKEEKNTDSKDTNNIDADNIKTKLEKLKNLKDEGLITEEDFEKKKSELLDLI